MSNELNQEKVSLKQDQASCVKCAKCSCEGCYGDSRCNLRCTNWLDDVPGETEKFDVIEVHFKNTRKGFYRNSAKIPLQVGDMVAVEANPGHDIGRVSMMGRLVKLQMKKANLRPDFEILRVFRKAKPSDLERFEEAKAREVDTMIRSRKIAADLKLKMKIGDVEYQGDGNKAIFYYIADERVDFRQLIKVLAEVFKIRIEMKQIGARQEAGRIGGIGPCGRPLCCASWMTNFVSVATGAARYQDVSLNPQKLAGQCAKLKCCINFEVDSYVEAAKKMPPRDVVLETKDGSYYHFKTDLFKKEITYSTDKSVPANLVVLSPGRVFEVIALNKNGVKPAQLNPEGEDRKVENKAFGDILGQDSINRFDTKKKKRNRNGNRPKDGNGNGNGNEQRRQQGEAKAARQQRTPDAGRQSGDNSNNGQQHRRRPRQGGEGAPQHRRGGNRPQRQGGGKVNPEDNSKKANHAPKSSDNPQQS